MFNLELDTLKGLRAKYKEEAMEKAKDFSETPATLRRALGLFPAATAVGVDKRTFRDISALPTMPWKIS